MYNHPTKSVLNRFTDATLNRFTDATHEVFFVLTKTINR